MILVPAIERGVNEHEVGAIVRFGLEHPAVRGVNFQPVTHVGRHLEFDPMDRVTIPEVIRGIEAQTDRVFVKDDFVPVPCCFPTCSSVTYAYIDQDVVTPLPRVLNVDDYLDYITNRTFPDLSMDVKRALEGLWSAAAVPGSTETAERFGCAGCDFLDNADSQKLKKHVFMIMVKAYMDAYTLDVKQLMKCCVGVLTPDGRMIPFCAYNTVGYREQVRTQLAGRRLRSLARRRWRHSSPGPAAPTSTRARPCACWWATPSTREVRASRVCWPSG